MVSGGWRETGRGSWLQLSFKAHAKLLGVHTVFPGGEGKTGRVVDIRGWDVETGRSVASVTWADGTTNVYRVGHKGKVDLKCVGEAAGGFYYKEHLPKLGMGLALTAAALLPWLYMCHPGMSSSGWGGCFLRPSLPPSPQASQQSCSAG